MKYDAHVGGVRTSDVDLKKKSWVYASCKKKSGVNPIPLNKLFLV